MAYSVEKPKYPASGLAESGVYPYLASVGVTEEVLLNSCVRRMRVIAVTSSQTINVADEEEQVFQDIPVWVHTDIGARLALIKGEEATASDYFKNAAFMFTLRGKSEETYSYVAVLTNRTTGQAIGVIDVLVAPLNEANIATHIMSHQDLEQHMVQSNNLTRPRPTYTPYLRVHGLYQGEIYITRWDYPEEVEGRAIIRDTLLTGPVLFSALYDLTTLQTAVFPTYDEEENPGSPYFQSKIVPVTALWQTIYIGSQYCRLYGYHPVLSETLGPSGRRIATGFEWMVPSYNAYEQAEDYVESMRSLYLYCKHSISASAGGIVPEDVQYGDIYPYTYFREGGNETVPGTYDEWGPTVYDGVNSTEVTTGEDYCPRFNPLIVEKVASTRRYLPIAFPWTGWTGGVRLSTTGSSAYTYYPLDDDDNTYEFTSSTNIGLSFTTSYGYMDVPEWWDYDEDYCQRERPEHMWAVVQFDNSYKLTFNHESFTEDQTKDITNWVHQIVFSSADSNDKSGDDITTMAYSRVFAFFPDNFYMSNTTHGLIGRVVTRGINDDPEDPSVYTYEDIVRATTHVDTENIATYSKPFLSAINIEHILKEFAPQVSQILSENYEGGGWVSAHIADRYSDYSWWDHIVSYEGSRANISRNIRHVVDIDGRAVSVSDSPIHAELVFVETDVDLYISNM